mmetsp:Transcript_99605/g.281060  ORF Transcript_99605/g.281060 Transcript_99605/m.281060 type:complete len:207 (-) Transcript_99605:2-622(-)
MGEGGRVPQHPPTWPGTGMGTARRTPRIIDLARGTAGHPRAASRGGCRRFLGLAVRLRVAVPQSFVAAARPGDSSCGFLLLHDAPPVRGLRIAWRRALRGALPPEVWDPRRRLCHPVFALEWRCADGDDAGGGGCGRGALEGLRVYIHLRFCFYRSQRSALLDPGFLQVSEGSQVRRGRVIADTWTALSPTRQHVGLRSPATFSEI